MKKPLLPEWRYWPAVMPVGILALVVYGSFSPHENRGGAEPNYQTYNYGSLSDFGDWITKDSISFFTFVLALLTAGLVWVAFLQIGFLRRSEAATAKLGEVSERQMLISGQQTDILEKQKEIARREFLSNNRPKLRVRLLRMDTPVLGQHLIVHYEVVNIGGTSATIIDNEVTIRVDVPAESRGAPSKSATRTFTRQFHFADEVRQGEAWPATGEMTVFDPGWGFNGIGAWWAARLYVIGTIRYSDGNGVLRRTRFYRVATTDLNRFIKPNFDPTTAADHEYED